MHDHGTSHRRVSSGKRPTGSQPPSLGESSVSIASRELVEDDLPGPELRGRVRPPVHAGEVFGRGQSRIGQGLWCDHGVEQAGLTGELRIEHRPGRHGVVEVRRGQPVTGQHDGEPGQGESDAHLIESELVLTVGADAVVGCHEEERAGGERVSRARDRDGSGERQNPFGQCRSQAEHGERAVGRPVEDPQVEPRREVSRSPSEEDDGLVALRSVERFVEFAQHRYGEDVDLSVVHGEDAHLSAALVGHKVAHGRSSRSAAAKRFTSAPSPPRPGVAPDSPRRPQRAGRASPVVVRRGRSASRPDR